MARIDEDALVVAKKKPYQSVRKLARQKDDWHAKRERKK